jgi:hypothetical protein
MTDFVTWSSNFCTGATTLKTEKITSTLAQFIVKIHPASSSPPLPEIRVWHDCTPYTTHKSVI